MLHSATVQNDALLSPAADRIAVRAAATGRWAAVVRSGAFLNWTAWTCVGLLLAQQTYMARMAAGSPVSWLAAFKGSIVGSLLWAAFTPLILRTARRFRVDGISAAPNLVVHLVVGTLFCAGDAVANIGLAQLLGDSLPRFPLLFWRLYPFNMTCYLAVVAIGHAVDFARLYRERAVAEAELSAELSTARLRMLESQLRPHFLFNTLNTIAETVHSNPQRADDMILRLAALLRASLHLTEGHEVPLRDEVATVDHYLAIVRARYEDRLRVTIDVPADLDGALVPAMVLQPLVENALQHGVEPVDTETQVSIRAERRGRSLVLTVEDDGAGLAHGEVADGVGLRNTRGRLHHLYGDAARLTLLAREGGGAICEVVLPMEHAR